MKNNEFGEKVITTWDAETDYGISAATVNYWCKKGYIPATKVQSGKREIWEFKALDFALFLFTARAGKFRRKIQMVPAGELSIDPALPGRAQVYLDTVENYVAAKKTGAKLPPIVAARIDGRLLMIEGAHRYQAALTSKEAKVPVQVLDGLEWEDALSLALKANTDHGRPLSSADKRQRVESALKSPHYAAMSSRALEPILRASHNLIATVRREMQGEKRPTAKLNDDRLTPTRIAGQIRGKLQVLALTHPKHANRIAEILLEIEPASLEA